MGPAEREWLEEKYPGWNERWGKQWDVIIDNLLAGKRELTYPETLPVVCNMCQLPMNNAPDKVFDHSLEHKGRWYHFCSEGCKWCFEQEPARYEGHLTLVDRFLAGMIQPMNLEGGLKYMNLAPGEMGDDAHGYAWVDAYRAKMRAAA